MTNWIRSINCEYEVATEEELVGATAKRSLGVYVADFERTPKRVWRWHPVLDDGAIVENVSA